MRKRKCSSCKKLKNTTAFYSSKSHKNGLRNECIDCTKSQALVYYSNNKEKYSISAKKYKKKHQDELKKYQKKWYHENIDKRRKLAREYYEGHKEERKLYRQKNKKHRVKYSQRYFQENKEKIRNRLVNRAKTDINYKLLLNLRGRIRMAIKYNYKESSSKNLLGCTIKNIKTHLENQFTKGMSWKNYGKWHVDHIRPCASFDLSKLKEQRKCFNYKNLQPLWAEENRKKGEKYE